MTAPTMAGLPDPTATDALRRAGGPDDSSARIAFTVGTLVTDPAQYDLMRETFAAAGFSTADCEYLHVDNTGRPQTCAYRGLNAVLDAARGQIVILCHQDVRLVHDTRAVLEARLAELARVDPAWALAGNAGGIAPGRLALRITDPHGADQQRGRFPARVMSLDENFIVVRRAARVGFSRDLEGFHFYGADICLAADVMGYSAYVIDFHLRHLSGGRKDTSFYAAEAAFVAKWSRALKPRWMQTTCSLVRLSGTRGGRLIGGLVRAPYGKLSRRLRGAVEPCRATPLRAR